MLQNDNTKISSKNTSRNAKSLARIEITKNNATKEKKILKPHDWLISSGDVIYGMDHADVIYGLTKPELGLYIRNNIGDLYDHFLFMASSILDNSRGKIGKMMRKISKTYGKDFLEPFSNDELNKIVKLIKINLKNLSDIEIVSEFNCFGSSRERPFVRISKLSKKMNYLVVHDVDSDAPDDNNTESDSE